MTEDIRHFRKLRILYRDGAEYQYRKVFFDPSDGEFFRLSYITPKGKAREVWIAKDTVEVVQGRY